jgi:hypothetical protein
MHACAHLEAACVAAVHVSVQVVRALLDGGVEVRLRLRVPLELQQRLGAHDAQLRRVHVVHVGAELDRLYTTASVRASSVHAPCGPW